MKELKKGQVLYYAQCLDSCSVFEVLELKIRTIEDTWFSGVEKRTRHAYLFSNNDINKKVFFDREEALDVVKTAEKSCKRKVSSEKYYEEY